MFQKLLFYCQLVLGYIRQVYRITESVRLEKSSKIIKSNHQPNTTMPAQPYPKVPHLRVF